MWFCRKARIFKKKNVLFEQSLAFSKRSQKTSSQELFTFQPGNFSDLSEAFQASKFNCSAILLAVAHTDSQLETIKAESFALDYLEKRDFGGIGFIFTEAKMSRKDEDELVSIQGKYIDVLMD